MSNIEKYNFISFFKKHIPEVVDYQNQLNEVSQHWSIINMLSDVSEGGTNMQNTQNEFNILSENLITNLAEENVKQLSNELVTRSQVVVDIVIRNLFERTADIGFLATDDSIREFYQKYFLYSNELDSTYVFDSQSPICNNCPEQFVNQCKSESIDKNFRNILQPILCKDNKNYKKSTLNEKLENITKDIRTRFNEYVKKYSVYFDVILTDTKGNVLVTLDENNKVEKSNDSIISDALTTKEDFVEKLGYSDLRSDRDTTLMYAYKVTQNNDKNSNPLGVLVLCFRFRDEMRKIYKGLKESNPNLNLMLLDKDGVVISSSDLNGFPVGTQMETSENGKFMIVNYSGKKYIVSTSKTKGYQGFYGLGWLGHAMICIEEAFDKNSTFNLASIEKKILDTVLHSTSLFSHELQDIPLQAKKIQDNLNRTVWNGNLHQHSTIGKKLLTQVSNTGEKTKEIFHKSIKSLNETVLQTIISEVSFQALQAIDIMDRNLYERANDCRWWALTPKFAEILSKESISSEDVQQMGEILKYINDLYTVYTNLFIYDKFGKIIAVSNEEQTELIDTKLSEEWVNKTLSITDSQKYSVSNFENTFLYNNEYTYIYGAAISNVGGIGIVFDSKPQFKDILLDILPHGENNFALFTNKNKSIISSTSQEHCPGDIIDIDSKFFELSNNESYSNIIEYNNRYYAVGSRCSFGYREYKNGDGYSNDIISLVFIYLSDKIDNKEVQLEEKKYFSNVSFKKDSSNIKEVGTFFIGNNWYGFELFSLVGAIGIDSLQSINSGGIVSGRVMYEDLSIEVINLHKHLNIKPSNEQEIIIFEVERKNTNIKLGLIVDKLGDFCEVPESQLRDAKSNFAGVFSFVSYTVNPPEKINTILQIIDPEALLHRLQGD